jgi:alkanesulfonate monooxygenase
MSSSQTGKKSLVLNAFVEMCASNSKSIFPPTDPAGQALAAKSNEEGLVNTDGHTGSGHQSPGLWRHPDDQSSRFNEIEHWTELAKLLEEAKFHGIFIADVLGKVTPLMVDAPYLD